MKKLKVLFLIMCMFIPFFIAGCGEDDSAMKVPANLTAENGRIIFDVVKDAEYYNICVDDLSFDVYLNKTNKLFEEDGKLTYKASDILEFGNTYSIKVKACHKERGDSEYTEAIEYFHIEDLKTITSSQINNKFLSWADVKNATEYELKIITPDDSVLLDDEGNKLEGDILDIIEKANVQTFNTNVNQFNFASIIKSVGKYSFYARAKYVNDTNVATSDFVNLGSYEHFVKLATPKILDVAKNENGLHLLAEVDKLANSITIECGSYVSTETIANNNNILQTANILDLNLSAIFGANDDKKLKFEDAKEYAFSISTSFDTSAKVNYYIDSEKSAPKNYANIVKLYAPTNLSITYQEVNDTFIAKWDKSTSNHQYVAGYKLYVATSSGIVEHNVNASARECLIGADVIAVAISTIGVNNYFKSNISEFVQNPNLTLSLNGFNASVSGRKISWNSVANYYILIINDELFTATTNSFSVETFMSDSKTENVTLVAVKNGYKVNEKTLSVNIKQALATPTTVDDITTYYKPTINITPNVNAIGYYLYVSRDGADYRMIDELFTTTSINLKNYLTMDTHYKIKIQAVASPFGIFEDSEASDAITLALPLKLESPKLYKIDNEEKAVIEENGKKYLYFYEVENAHLYEVLINYNIKIVSSSIADESGLFKIDITDFVKVAGDLPIKIKAISSVDSYDDSDYVEYIFSQTIQLNQPENLKLSELNGVYTLTFDEVENATAYKINITNPNRDIYNIESSSTSIDITEYIKGQGNCFIFVTAISSNEAYKESSIARLTAEIK